MLDGPTGYGASQKVRGGGAVGVTAKEGAVSGKAADEGPRIGSFVLCLTGVLRFAIRSARVPALCASVPCSPGPCPFDGMGAHGDRRMSQSCCRWRGSHRVCHLCCNGTTGPLCKRAAPMPGSDPHQTRPVLLPSSYPRAALQ